MTQNNKANTFTTGLVIILKLLLTAGVLKGLELFTQTIYTETLNIIHNEPVIQKPIILIFSVIGTAIFIIALIHIIYFWVLKLLPEEKKEEMARYLVFDHVFMFIFNAKPITEIDDNKERGQRKIRSVIVTFAGILIAWILLLIIFSQIENNHLASGVYISVIFAPYVIGVTHKTVTKHIKKMDWNK